MRITKFHWIIGFPVVLCVVLVFYSIWNVTNTEPADDLSQETIVVKPSIGGHQAFNPASQETMKNQPLSTQLDDAIQPESHMIDLNAGKQSADEIPTDVQHLGEYIDPDGEVFLPEENPRPAQHLGDFIDPDERENFIQENQTKEQHLGEFIDPDNVDYLSQEDTQPAQHLGDYIGEPGIGEPLTQENVAEEQHLGEFVDPRAHSE